MIIIISTKRNGANAHVYINSCYFKTLEIDLARIHFLVEQVYNHISIHPKQLILGVLDHPPPQGHVQQMNLQSLLATKVQNEIWKFTLPLSSTFGKE
jgi:hypothetical protein